MLRLISPMHPPKRLRQVAIAPILGAGLILGGCSADFLRFDSPVFNLNGDTSAVDDRTADATHGASPYDQRDTAAPVPDVSRGAPAAATRNYTPKQVARAEPIIEPTSPQPNKAERAPYRSMTTGALPARGSITVQPGDTLYQLSRRHGVSVSAIRQANGLTGNVIRPGQKLIMPGGGARSDTRTETWTRQAANPPARSAPRYAPNTQYGNPAPRDYRPAARASDAHPSGANSFGARSSGNGGYVVRRGDSLYAISRRTGVSVAELKRLNGITNVRAIKPGVRLSLGRGAPTVQPSTRPSTQVASRSEIRSKSIKTMPIVREKSQSTTGTYQPRILNRRPDAPIATKPERKVAMVPPANTTEKFRWPARGRVIAPFNHSGRGSKNDGINIALPLGTNVEAAGNGVVAYAGSELKGYGNLVLVRHDNGWVSAYAHASQVLVKRGDRVNRGQIIAKAGRTGGVSQPQLHFELRKGAKPVDPMPHLERL